MKTRYTVGTKLQRKRRSGPRFVCRMYTDSRRRGTETSSSESALKSAGSRISIQRVGSYPGSGVRSHPPGWTAGGTG
eukprot:scaffold176975_cov33-Tisochrysis_lutea.AAC.1